MKKSGFYFNFEVENHSFSISSYNLYRFIMQG